MSLADILLVSAFSIALVFFVLVALFVLIVIFSKAFGSVRVSSDQSLVPEIADTPLQSAGLSDGTAGQDMSLGTLKLKNVDEKTAAMIMAIVSHESGIPLSQLRFKSIKALEENN
jgi:hypothetical protein